MAAHAAPVLNVASYRKMVEMKVELAWLENQATFPCHLGAQVEGTALEVCGYVPNEATRQQALRLACLSNIRQLGVAAQMYQNENRQVLPFANWDNGNSAYPNANTGWLYTTPPALVARTRRVGVVRNTADTKSADGRRTRNRK